MFTAVFLFSARYLCFCVWLLDFLVFVAVFLQYIFYHADLLCFTVSVAKNFWFQNCVIMLIYCLFLYNIFCSVFPVCFWVYYLCFSCIIIQGNFCSAYEIVLLFVWLYFYVEFLYVSIQFVSLRCGHLLNWRVLIFLVSFVLLAWFIV